MEQMTTHVGIEPGRGLVGRFGDTVILIPRSEAPDDDSADPDEAARELLDLAAVVASDRQVPPSTIAARLAAWVIGRLAGDPLAFGIVVPARDGVVMFLRGAVWCTVTEGGSTRELSGEQALTWVDQIVPGTFERLAIGAAAGQPVRADPLSDLRDGVVPGQGFVLTRAESVPSPEPAMSAPESASGPEPAASATASGPEPPRPRPRAPLVTNPPRPGLPRSPRARMRATSRPCWCRPARTPRRPPPTAWPGQRRPTRPSRPPRRWCRRPAPRCRPLVRRWRRSHHWAF